MNLQIFLDLTYNQLKKIKVYSHQGQTVQIFLLIFTYNQSKIFLIYLLPRGGGGHMHTRSLPEVAFPLLSGIVLLTNHCHFIA